MAVQAKDKIFKDIEKCREKHGLAETIRRMSPTGANLDEAVRRQKIDDQWQRAKPGQMGAKAHSGERKMLYGILDADEKIVKLIAGTMRADTARTAKHTGVAVATNKRVIFVDRGILGSTEVQQLP